MWIPINIQQVLFRDNVNALKINPSQLHTGIYNHKKYKLYIKYYLLLFDNIYIFKFSNIFCKKRRNHNLWYTCLEIFIKSKKFQENNNFINTDNTTSTFLVLVHRLVIHLNLQTSHSFSILIQ